MHTEECSRGPGAYAAHVTGRYPVYFAVAGTGGRFRPVLLYQGWWLKASRAVRFPSVLCSFGYTTPRTNRGWEVIFRIGRLMSRCSEQREDRDNVVRA
jgi:hypothetical protein